MMCVLCMYECLYTRLRVCGSTCMCVTVLMHMCGYSKPGAGSRNLPGGLILPFEAGLSQTQSLPASPAEFPLAVPISAFRFCHSFQGWKKCVYMCVHVYASSISWPLWGVWDSKLQASYLCSHCSNY